MDDRDFMDMMFQGMTKTTHAETSYWGFDEVEDVKHVNGRYYWIFYVDESEPETKRRIGEVDSEADAAFITAVHGAFPDIYRRWLQALDEADEKDTEKDQAEGLAADLSRRLLECERTAVVTDRLGDLPPLSRTYEDVEEWHGKATGS